MKGEPPCARFVGGFEIDPMKPTTCQVCEHPHSLHTRGMAKRGYSREFTPKTERRVQLMIDRVPPTLLNAAKAKAKREGISLRALILGWLKDWIET